MRLTADQLADVLARPGYGKRECAIHVPTLDVVATNGCKASVAVFKPATPGSLDKPKTTVVARSDADSGDSGRPKRFRLTAVAPKESDIQAAIIKRLLLHHDVAAVFRINVSPVMRESVDRKGRKRKSFVRSIVGYSRTLGMIERGIADLLVVMRDGRAVWIECKARDGRLTAEQQAFQAAMPLAGVARSIEEAVDAMRSSCRVLRP